MKYFNIVGSLYNLFDAVTMIIASLYFKFISKYYAGIHYFFLFFISLSVTISYILPDSPKFLISIQKFSEARRVLNFMAKIN